MFMSGATAVLMLRAASACIKALFWPRFDPTFRQAGDISTNRNRLRILLMTPRLALITLTIATALTLPQSAAVAATCGTGNFDAWLADFKTEAANKGISQAAINAGLSG